MHNGLKKSKTELRSKGPSPAQKPQPNQRLDNTEEELLTIVIDLGKGREESIIVFEGDDPDRLAAAFCAKYNLKGEQERKLSVRIRQHMDEVLRDDKAINETQKDALSRGLEDEDGTMEVGEEHTEDMKTNFETLKQSHEISHLENIHRKFSTGEVKKYSENVGCSPIAKRESTELVEIPWSEKAKAGTKSAQTYKQPANRLSYCEGNESGLHVEASEVSEFCKRKSPGRPPNSGEKMYQTAMIKKRQREQQAKEARKQREQAELRYATFKPEINRTSWNATTDLEQRSKDRLYVQAGVAHEKLESAKMAQLLKTQEICTFHPKINQRSTHLAVTRDKLLMKQMSPQAAENVFKSRFGILFEDAKRRVKHMHRMSEVAQDEECTFSPSINPEQEDGNLRQPFLERNKRYVERQHLRAKSTVSIPPAGVYTFSPLVGRPPKAGRKRNNQSIGEYLYDQQKGIDERINLKRSQSLERPLSVLEDSLSRGMIEHCLDGCFGKIFFVLDSNEDGVVIASDANVAGLPKEIASIISPVLTEAGETKKGYSIEEFKGLCKKHYRGLNVQNKDVLRNFMKQKRASNADASKSNLTFKPCISNKSKELASQMPGVGFDVYTRLTIKHKISKIRLDLKRNTIEETSGPVCIH